MRTYEIVRGIPRRAFLASALGMALAPGVSLAARMDDDTEIERVRKRAKAAGLGEFGVSRNEDYLAIGDAPEDFRERALSILLGFARDYLGHFRNFMGFDVAKPKERMTLIVASSSRALSAYLGEPIPPSVRGMYIPSTNDLMFFDNRSEGPDPLAEKDNTLVLFHEAMHQLCFNTGLLRRGGDIPKAIAEGLANYAEVRSLNGKTKIGAVNQRRILGLTGGGRVADVKLPPVSDLIATDARLDQPATEQAAYSEAWLLVHFLMKTKKPKFRDYLKAIKPRDDESRRMQDWTAAFGPTKAMDAELARYLKKIT